VASFQYVFEVDGREKIKMDDDLERLEGVEARFYP
jgi:hypothetical protein